MSRVDKARGGEGRPPVRTLHLLVAADSVQWGVSAGRGKGFSWVSGGVAEASDAGDPQAPPPSSLQRLSQWLDEPGNAAMLSSVRQARVVVSDALIGVGTLPWSGALAGGDGAAVAAAKRQLTAAGFELPHDARVRLDDNPFGVPRLAVAYPGALPGALDTAARRMGWRRWSVLPLSVAAWRGVGRRGAAATALAVLDEGHVVLVRGGRSLGLPPSSVGQVDVRPLDRAQPLDAALDAAWRRCVLREPAWSAVGTVATVSLSPWLDSAGPLPPPFSDAPRPACADGAGVPAGLRRLASNVAEPRLALDANAAVPGIGPGRWLLLAACVGAVAWAGFSAMRTAEAGRMPAAQPGRSVRAQPAATPLAAQRRDEVARIQSVNEAIQALNLPIGALLQALQPPRDIRVSVLGVETQAVAHDGRPAEGVGAGGLKVRAEAESAGEMARYVAYVAERKPFHAAYLESHEVVLDAATSGPRYRFTLEARWTD